MKKISGLLFFTLLFMNASAQSDIDVLHYTFKIELNDNNDSIYGEASIKFIPAKGSQVVDFDLSTITGKGTGMKVQSVQYLYGWPGEINMKKSDFTQTNNKISIPLGEKIVKNDTGFVIINYKGIPSDGLIISKNKYGNRTFFADNWPNRGHNWLPCHDDPADKASVEFIVTAPQHYQVVANGVQLEETNLPANKKRTHWKEDVPVSTKVMVIGVADFAVNLSGMINGCIPVYSWVYPEDRNKGFYDYAQAAEILPYYIKNVGPYAYKKLANVESKTIFGGLENANTIFYSESSIDGNRKSESLLAHEIAHQWFGNMATEKTFAHLWLSEGFATYMTILYMENKYGTDTATKMLLEDRSQVIDFVRRSNRSVVDNNPDYMELLNPNSYQKGGWVLHMLRRQLGDSVFWKSIRTYYSTYAGKTADTDDLRKVFEKISGKDLRTFFTQWLFTPGIPDLKISWKYQPNEKKITIMVEQLQTQPYNFPLELAIGISSAKPKIEKLSITKKTETFTIASLQKPLSVIADPLVSLLFSGKITETK
ncbi:MAG TPA: M1 family aminopeptidase [Chitinophagaceae bacterium]